MSDPFVGEIRMFGGNFAPAGWALCDGQAMPIAENDVLFTLIGTTYGGDGQNTFALPDLRGRIPLHQGTNYPIGQSAGSEDVTLTTQQMPIHTHTAQAQSESGSQATPANGLWAFSSLNQFSTNSANGTLNAGAIAPAGGSQPHTNMMPYLVVSFIISLYGVFPQQS